MSSRKDEMDKIIEQEKKKKKKKRKKKRKKIKMQRQLLDMS